MNDLISPTGLPAPLRVAPDMPATWSNLDTDFDTAASRIIEAHRADGQHHDLPLLDLRGWALVPTGDKKFGVAPLAGHHPPRALRANGFGNLMSRLGAPAEFVRDRLPAPLQLAVGNYLLASLDDGVEVTLRLRGDEVAAVVSGRYAPLDPEELLACVRDSLAQADALESVQVRAVATGLVDNLRLTFPSEQRAIKPGDVSALGLDITTSSFGKSAVHIRSIVFRLICSNGMRVAEPGSALSFRHVGDSDRLRAAVADAIPTVVARARGVMNAWERAVTLMVERAQDLVQNMRELTLGERDRVEQAIANEVGQPALPAHVSLYDVVNGFTAAAQEAEPARRLDLESLAGQVLQQLGGRS
jgi:hypothetical protein